MCVDGIWDNCDAPPVEDEICDGVDNDCNGLIDDGEALCGVGFACVDAVCVEIDPDDDGDLLPADGDPAAGCACQGNLSRDPRGAAGTLLLALLCAFALRRRRQ